METSTPPPIDSSQVKRQGNNWPKTIGVIALVFGILGTLGAAVAPFSLFITEASFKTFEQQGADPDKIDAYLEKLTSLSYLSSGVMLVLGVLLIIGATALLKRKQSAPLLLQVWAVLKIIGGGYINFRNSQLTKAQLEITSSIQGNDEVAQMTESITSAAVTVGLIFGTLWLIALPVFFLIWFNRAKVKAQIAEW